MKENERKTREKNLGNEGKKKKMKKVSEYIKKINK